LQEAEQLISASTGPLFGPRTPRQRVHKPAKAKSGRSSLRANQVGIFRGLAFLVLAEARRQDHAAVRQPSSPVRLLTLRMFVTGLAAILRRSRHAPAREDEFAFAIRFLRTIGANWSGKIEGKSGRLPVRSCCARNQSRMAAWPLVKE
jgi:hypothetical protein